MSKNKGTVIQVMGPVLDIRFPDDQLPLLLNAIEIPLGDHTIVAEVAQHIGDNVARCIAMAQNGEMQGGALGRVWVYHARRKSMNTFFFKVTDNPEEDVWFIGRMNDDVNTYVNGGRHGELWYQNARLNVFIPFSFFGGYTLSL